MNRNLKAHWRRCPVPPLQINPVTGATKDILSGHKRTKAWKWRKYIVVECTGRHIIIFPDGRESSDSATVMGGAGPYTSKMVKDWVLKRVQELTPVDVEDLSEIYNYDA